MTSSNNKQYIMLGKLNAHHGIKGWLKVFSYTEPKQNILSYATVFLFKENQIDKKNNTEIAENYWKEVQIEDGRLQGKGVVVHIKGYDNRESSAELIGSSIGIARDSLASLDKDDYYWIELIGLQVINQQGVALGCIKSMLATAANDVMVVKPLVVTDGLQKEYLIPYVMGLYVLDVDLKSAVVQVDWDVDF